MKVKIGELKTQLSKYVHSLREGGESIEVCVREKTVAYLTPAKQSGTEDLQEERDLAQRLERRGVRLRQRGRISDCSPSPEKPGDGRKWKNSVVAIRSEKDW